MEQLDKCSFSDQYVEMEHSEGGSCGTHTAVDTAPVEQGTGHGSHNRGGEEPGLINLASVEFSTS